MDLGRLSLIDNQYQYDDWRLGAVNCLPPTLPSRYVLVRLGAVNHSNFDLEFHCTVNNLFYVSLPVRRKPNPPTVRNINIVKLQSPINLRFTRVTYLHTTRT